LKAQGTNLRLPLRSHFVTTLPLVRAAITGWRKLLCWESSLCLTLVKKQPLLS
jgi:hypothetical protein